MIAEAGHEADHVIDVGAGSMTDQEIWKVASENSAVIVTKDEDFSLMGAGEDGVPCIVWIRLGNTTRRALLEWFAPLLPQIIDAIKAGNKLIEIR